MDKTETDPYKRFFIQRLYNSKAWLMYCLSQLLLTTLLIFYVMIDLKEHSRSSIVFSFEVLLTFAIMFDVTVHYYLNGTESFKDPLFLLDIIILTSFFLVPVWMMTSYSAQDEEIDVGLLIVRGVFQLFRFFVFGFKMHRKIQLRKAIEEISFGDKEGKDASDAFGGRFVDVGEDDNEVNVELEMGEMDKVKREVALII